MKNKLLITKINGQILTALVQEDGRVCGLQTEPADNQSILGNIYVGKVRNVVKNINAAFVEFQKGQMGYLSLQSAVCPIHTDAVKYQENRVLIGDEIIVQVEKEAVKTKPPTLTGRLDFSGKFLVLTVGNPQISISRKITEKETRQRLNRILKTLQDSQEYGFIARTNSAQASEEELRFEVEKLKKKYEEVVRYGKHKARFNCLYQAPSAYLSSVQNLYQQTQAEVITDSEEIYTQIDRFAQESGWKTKPKLTLWNTEQGKLDAVYNLSKTLERALKEKVWLKTGAYLIIQPTEAFVSIDVNTGKAISKKGDVQNTFLKVNLEAAKEIALQLRLRNLSGIILIDFIDMASEEANKQLLDCLREEFQKDAVPTKLVDMTKLGLVEVTRKKVRKPLYEQIEKGMVK